VNAAEAQQLIDRYAVSYYHDGPLQPCHPSDLARAKAEIQKPGELLKAMEHNGREAKEAVEYIAERFKRAQQDGLFETEAIEATDKRFHEPWLKAIQVQRGDLNRSRSELLHWREYWTWAKANPSAKPMDVRALADAKSYEDTRLPPEAR
jgi:hypothetical protein